MLATFGIYKYLHFDGDYDPNTDTKSTADDTEGGVGLKYWLESINIANRLVLKGSDVNSTESNDVEAYTLSAYLTGVGGIDIPEDNKVIIGDSKQPALAIEISGEGGAPQQN